MHIYVYVSHSLISMSTSVKSEPYYYVLRDCPAPVLTTTTAAAAATLKNIIPALFAFEDATL